MVVKGTINKLKQGDAACFTGRLGRFWIQHPALSDITQYGVYEVTIELAGIRQASKSDGIPPDVSGATALVGELGSAPLVEKCVFLRPASVPIFPPGGTLT
jgi:hypothetical protein